MSLRVGFLTTLGVNVGDEFIREGIRAVLDRVGVPYRPLYVNKHDPRTLQMPAEDEVEVVADKYWDSDLFIQSGAPVYWHLSGGKYSSVNSDWSDWFWTRRVLGGGGGEGPEFVNLGAGACEPWGGTGEGFLGDSACADFAQSVGRRSASTVVRDPVAAHILRSLGVDHHEVPCPAFLAGARHCQLPQGGGAVGVNLMSMGGHFDLSNDFDATAWREQCRRLTGLLRRLGPLVYICHDAAERDYAATLARPGERVFGPAGWRDYLDAYAQCAVVVANRVHGAVVAAGLGVPSVIVGNDTRTRIGEYIGLPGLRAGREPADAIFEHAARQFERRASERDRLLDLRDRTVARYSELLAPTVHRAVETGRTRKAPPGPPFVARACLASVGELTSGRFRSHVSDVDRFADAHGLRRCNGWSADWEYPWLWFAGLGLIHWQGKHVVDWGSDRSPIPWMVGRLGAKLTLVGSRTDALPGWENLRDDLGVSAEWRVDESGRLPLPDESADVVTSFSVIEHLPDKGRAIDEVVRVLKPGGIFAASFDICEPSMGMTFPEWNGRAMGMREFEELVWFHPGFGNSEGVRWNTADIPAYVGWHRQSAAHHNYATGSAVLVKKA